MTSSPSTCWTLVQGARAGRKQDREDFARRYAPVIEAYLEARWRATPRFAELEDAVQELFVDCFRKGGLLDRIDERQPGGFRAFLYGAARITALRFERRAHRRREQQAPSSFEADHQAKDETTLSRVFDRAWAKSLMKEALRLQKEKAGREERAGPTGVEAAKRVELLRLRFQEDLPIREIARRWSQPAASLHKEYARARQEFKAALVEVVSYHHPGSPAEVERECAALLDLVS